MEEKIVFYELQKVVFSSERYNREFGIDFVEDEF